MTIFDTITPADLGLPPKFDKFRLAQREALDWSSTIEDLIQAVLLPTGAGKTLFALALAKILGVKACYLVATKVLQEQVYRDAAPLGAVIIKGRNNYECENYPNCEIGFDKDCSLCQTMACPYNQAVEAAKDSPLPISNYAYWMHARMNTRNALERDGCPIELLICDEAHDLENQLTDFASVEIYEKWITKEFHFADSGVMNEDGQAAWEPWATKARATADERMRHIEAANEQNYRQDERWKDANHLYECANKVLSMSSANWVWQFTADGDALFQPVRINAFLPRLFSGVPHVLLMSATLTGYTLKLVMPHDLAYAYRAWPSVFNPGHAPVYHIPTAKLSWKSTDEDYCKVISQADAIMRARPDRKGIIHTVSYARVKRLLEHSGCYHRFIWNESGRDLSRTLEQFRSASPSSGAVLITPSVEQAHDFAGDQAEYQILIKFPFPNETQKVIKERCSQIAGYRLNYAAQKVVQIRGRPWRSETDRSELFILDNACRQLTGPAAREYVPAGFQLFTVTQIPPAPPRTN